jgi:hypothetical protein
MGAQNVRVGMAAQDWSGPPCRRLWDRAAQDHHAVVKASRRLTTEMCAETFNDCARIAWTLCRGSFTAVMHPVCIMAPLRMQLAQ